VSGLEEEVLKRLDDWKTAREVAREMHVSIERVKQALERLLEMRKVWHDGSLFINRYGRR